MIQRLLDKLIFGLALLLCLQVPLLVEYYHQFLAGQYESTKWQIDQYALNASQHGFASVGDMIARHLQNEEPSVRYDAVQKQKTIDLFEMLQKGLIVFDEGGLLQKAYYIFQPSRFDDLKSVISRYKPGLPLTTEGMVFGVVAALLLNMIIVLPLTFLSRLVFRSSTV